jgi:hypothetical protein
MKLVLIAALTLSATYAVAQQPDASFERSFEVGATIDLDVATGRGDITVRTGPAGSARVTGQLVVGRGGGGSWRWNFWRRDSRLSEEELAELVRLFETDPPVELFGGELRVGHVDGEWQQGFSMSYEIEVPAETDVRSRTGSGRQSIEGVSGMIEATAGSGSLNLRDLTGMVGVRTGSGSIRATNLSGEFDAQAGSGSIRVDESVLDNVSVTTGSGSIEIAGVDGELTARTGSGSVTVQGQPEGPWNLRTGSGSINLRLPAEAEFSLDARAGSGGVSTDHPLTVQGRIERGQLTGQVRGGGPMITARTGSGGIRIE